MIQVLALCGGVGGAKLALGLHHVLPPGDLMVMVNTGDDFEHLGLAISPDLDTVMYTLGGVSNPELGWGRAGETWNFMAEIERLGGETWFRVGDKDLAVHIERTRRLAAGEPLSAITVDMSRHFGIVSRILPMTNDMVRTMVVTEEGTLDFQHYFVQRRCEPVVKSLAYAGASDAPRAVGDPPVVGTRQLAGHCPLPFESLVELGTDAGNAFLPRSAARKHGAGDRRVAPHRRPGGEGADRENHARSAAGSVFCHHRLVLRRRHRRLRAG